MRITTLLCCLGLISVAACDEAVVPEPVSEPVVYTDRRQYFFSDDFQRDTICLTVYNGSDSIIHRWYPTENLDLKQVDGTWETILISETSPLGPLNPSTSASVETWIGNWQNNLAPGTYSFYGTVFYPNSQYMVRSTEFSLNWPDSQ